MAFFSSGKIFMSNFYTLSYSLPILLFVRNENFVKIHVKICKLIETRILCFIIDPVRHGVYNLNSPVTLISCYGIHSFKYKFLSNRSSVFSLSVVMYLANVHAE